MIIWTILSNYEMNIFENSTKSLKCYPFFYFWLQLVFIANKVKFQNLCSINNQNKAKLLTLISHCIELTWTCNTDEQKKNTGKDELWFHFFYCFYLKCKKIKSKFGTVQCTLCVCTNMNKNELVATKFQSLLQMNVFDRFLKSCFIARFSFFYTWAALCSVYVCCLRSTRRTPHG